MNQQRLGKVSIPPFDRRFFASSEPCTGIGTGDVGGKAQGLIAIRDAIDGFELDPSWDVEIGIPRMIVVTTSIFDAFIERNGLDEVALSDAPDDRIAHAFQQADLPTESVGDLKALIDEVHTPLAIRSSSLLEDAMHRPFAGVYATKMIPNNQHDPDIRFRRLIEAIKFVYASTFFKSAKSYITATDKTSRDEKMAVLIQEVVGRRYDDRFYPTISGVAKSYNFYPSGRARPEEGVVNLALGLGKTIVDGGLCWVYSPAHPAAPPPYGSNAELLRNSQLKFWAVNMGRSPEHNPLAEAEHLVEGSLPDAEYDGSLRFVGSTYDASSDRLWPGIGRTGPRVLDFAPLLKLRELPLIEVIRTLLDCCRQATGAAVEIEFAVSADPGSRPRSRFGFLQVRPMVVSDDRVEISAEEWTDPSIVIASNRSMGNGVEESILDVVYVKPQTFEARFTGRIAEQLRGLNKELLARRQPYLLIGFGRWGSSDPWLGIPVEWGDIAGARVIVEATLPNMNVEASQGAHFFHNISSFQVSYLTVHHGEKPGIDWVWLSSLPAVTETDHVRHVRVSRPLLVKVDGRIARGAVWRRS